MLRIEFNALLCFNYHTIRAVLVSFITLFKTFDPIAIFLLGPSRGPQAC
jgi:hypothetical protein